MKNYKVITQELIKFLKDYLQTSGAKGFVLGLSGGLDSAVVAYLCHLVAPGKLELVMMPTKNSSKQHFDDAIMLSKKLSIEPKVIYIDDILSSFICATKDNPNPLRLGNLAARVRMCLLYDISAKLEYLVVGTSNKSELMLGYGTIYGDMACALNPIGNLLKTEVRELALELGVSQSIISKPPSADLWMGQSDEGDIGYSYDDIDSVLEDMQAGMGKDELCNRHAEPIVDEVLRRVKSNEFKRRMPQIANI